MTVDGNRVVIFCTFKLIIHSHTSLFFRFLINLFLSSNKKTNNRRNKLPWSEQNKTKFKGRCIKNRPDIELWNIDIWVHENYLLFSFFFSSSYNRSGSKKILMIQAQITIQTRTQQSEIQKDRFFRKQISKNWDSSKARSLPTRSDEALFFKSENPQRMRRTRTSAAKLNRSSTKLTKQAPIFKIKRFQSQKNPKIAEETIQGKAQHRSNRSRSSATNSDLFDESETETRSAWGRWRRSKKRWRELFDQGTHTLSADG